MIKAAFFDVYYTLIDIKDVNQNELEISSWSFLRKNGYNIELNKYLKTVSETYSKWRSYRLKNLIDVNCRVWWQETMLKLSIPATPALIDGFLRNRYNEYRKNIKLYGDVIETLDYLKSLGITVGAITNSSDGELVRGDLNFFNISNYFDILFISSELKLRKPNEKLYDTVLDVIPYAPSEILVVGDDYESDVKPWVKRGVKAYLINRNKTFKHDKNVISTLLDIKKIVKTR